MISVAGGNIYIPPYLTQSSETKSEIINMINQRMNIKNDSMYYVFNNEEHLLTLMIFSKDRISVYNIHIGRKVIGLPRIYKLKKNFHTFHVFISETKIVVLYPNKTIVINQKISICGSKYIYTFNTYLLWTNYKYSYYLEEYPLEKN